MAYQRLARTLADAGSPIVTTLPDGSIDHYCRVGGRRGGPVETREGFWRLIQGERTSIEFQPYAIEPGGQAVNSAEQLHALGGTVTCYGHLTAPVFDLLPFETVSMGEPADVYVFNFDDRDLMFVNNTPVTKWDVQKLTSRRTLDEIFRSDAISCSNWASLPGLESMFHQLGETRLPRVPFVLDPGDISGASATEIESLLRALTALQETFDVVYNGNRQEIRITAAPLAGSFADDHDRLEGIREATGITAVVLHAVDEAGVVTCDERSRVTNFHVANPVRHTGGGDRFTGGLTFALACGWDWETALACGNACAVGYVESGYTRTSEDIVTLAQNRAPPRS